MSFGGLAGHYTVYFSTPSAEVIFSENRINIDNIEYFPGMTLTVVQ